MTLCGSQMFRRAKVALVGLAALLVSNVAHAAPPTAITTCPVVITEPGQYYLANDLLACNVVGIGTGIDIQASHVQLRLDGHTIRPSFEGIGAGIRAIDQTDILIQGPGTISGFVYGVDFINVDFSTVSRVTANITFSLSFTSAGFTVSGSNNLLQGNEAATIEHGFGIVIGGSENKVISNVVNVSGFLGTGILLSGALNEVHANIVTGMNIFPLPTTTGIVVFSTQSNIAGNTVLGNHLDMQDENPDCDENQWRGNRFDTANQSCIQ